MKITASQLARWQADPALFIETQLIDPMTNKPYVLLPSQREFIKYAFKIDEVSGRLVYPEQIYSCGRKGGKTAFSGLMMLTAVLLFGGRYGEGYAASNDLEQSIGRVFQAVARIVQSSPLFSDAVVLRDKILFPSFGDSFIAAIASDAAGAAGHNASWISFDELWGNQTERGRRFWDEMSTSPVRKISGRLTTTYAGYSGESLQLEELYKRGMAQPEIAPNLHAGDGILLAWHHEPVAPWQTQAWLDEQRRSLRPTQYLRQIENRWVTNESSFIEMRWWDECTQKDLRPVYSDRNLPIWIGLDASVKRDSTAIVAVTRPDDMSEVKLVLHRIFQPSPTAPLDFAYVEETVRDLCTRFNVQEVRYDPYAMQSTAQRLMRDGVPMVEFPQSVPNLTESSTNLYELIKARSLVVYHDEDMRLAVSRAVAVETSRGWRITKQAASHKIDCIVALAMACHAAMQKPSSFANWHRYYQDELARAQGIRATPQPQFGWDFSGGAPSAPPASIDEQIQATNNSELLMDLTATVRAGPCSNEHHPANRESKMLVNVPGEISRIEMANRSDGRAYNVRIVDGRRVADMLETDFMTLYKNRTDGQLWMDLNLDLVRQLEGFAAR